MMRRRRSFARRLLVLLVVTLLGGAVVPQLTAEEGQPETQISNDGTGPTVAVVAAAGSTIGFTTQNGQTIDGVLPRTLDLPHLVLYRNGELTLPDERTLIVTVSDLPVPVSGVTATLTLQTYHGDPDLGGGLENRITVLRESKWLGANPDRDATVVFRHVFGPRVKAGMGQIATPTDYFHLDLTIAGEGTTVSEPVYAFSQDHALLLENQWNELLLDGWAMPDQTTLQELVVYYCDMFVFQRDPEDLASRLPRGEIPGYVQRELLPAMLEALRIQADEWGFGWQQGWTSHRSEDGKERLSVALSDGETWFHGEAPMRGHSGISLNTRGRANRNYGTLTEGLLSTFHHELFHNLQRGMVQELGGHGDVNGKDDVLRFFSEGTAVLAESVARGATEFAQASGARTYISHANGFIGHTNFHGDLNSSWAGMTPYRAAIYWRFLYEQCGGMVNRIKDPPAGMRMMRHILEILYAQATTYPSPSTDLEHLLPEVMDRVLKGPAGASCPFRTFHESLQRFARAIYQLRLAGGRCSVPGMPAGCGFYDPSNLYVHPPASTITYSGAPMVFGAADQPYPRGIRSSFGIDFVEVELDPGVQGKALAIEFSGDPEGAAEFGLEIWELLDSHIPDRGHTGIVQVVRATQLPARVMGRRLFFDIPEIDVGKANRLGLIITRLDSQENSDPVGAYILVLQPGPAP